MESCLLGALRPVTFPKPEGGQVEVNLPLSFVSH